MSSSFIAILVKRIHNHFVGIAFHISCAIQLVCSIRGGLIFDIFVSLPLTLDIFVSLPLAPVILHDKLTYGSRLNVFITTTRVVMEAYGTKYTFYETVNFTCHTFFFSMCRHIGLKPILLASYFH